MFAGMCQPRVVGTVGAEPFSARLRYTGAEDSDHPNLIKLTVTMPHIDGTEIKYVKILEAPPGQRSKFWCPVSLINQILLIRV